MVIMMAISPDLIETTSIDDKPTVKRYVHRVTSERYISYFHALNGAWTAPFVEGSKLDVLSRDICEESALDANGENLSSEIHASANGGVSGNKDENQVLRRKIASPKNFTLNGIDYILTDKEYSLVMARCRDNAFSYREALEAAIDERGDISPNHEREQLQALGESLQSGIPPLAAIGQPISLTGDPVEWHKIEKLHKRNIELYTVRDDSRSFPGNIDGCYEVIKGLRGQVSQLREEAIYAKDEADSIRVSLQSALDIKKKYHAETIRLNKLDNENRKIIADIYRDNRELQFSVDKLRSVTQVQRRAMLAASVLLIIVFIATVSGW